LIQIKTAAICTGKRDKSHYIFICGKRFRVTINLTKFMTGVSVYRPFTDESTSRQPASDINMSNRERDIALLGGALLTLFALIRRDALRFPAIFGAGVMFYKGATGNSPLNRLLGRNSAVTTNPDVVAVPHEQGFHITRSVTINRPASDLYAFWHDPRNLPQIIDYIESVQLIGDKQAHWTIRLPAGLKAEFDVEVYTDVPNEVISWRSLAGASIQNAGSIRFQPAAEGRGTQVHLTLEFAPPGGPLGRAALNLFGDVPGQYIHQYLRDFKQMMETGEKATTEGQTSGRVHEVSR
jgi:uncharacterized membrane protein